MSITIGGMEYTIVDVIFQEGEDPERYILEHDPDNPGRDRIYYYDLYEDELPSTPEDIRRMYNIDDGEPVAYFTLIDGIYYYT